MRDHGGHGGGLIFGPQLVSVERAQIPLPPWMGHQFSPCTAVGVISGEASPAPYRCRQEPRVDIVAGLAVVPGSMVYCGPDLPAEADVHARETCTLLPQGWPWRVPDRRDARQLQASR